MKPRTKKNELAEHQEAEAAQTQNAGVSSFVSRIVDAVREAADRPPPILLNVDDAAAYLGISRSALYRLVSSKDLPAPLDIAGCGSRWRRSDLEKWASKLRPRRGRPIEVATESPPE